MISVDGALYWAISCFDYGDDPIFDRQRYGPAWIVASRDGGATWDEDAMNGTFAGNLAAPRFLQFGRDNAGAVDASATPGAQSRKPIGRNADTRT